MSMTIECGTHGHVFNAPISACLLATFSMVVQFVSYRLDIIFNALMFLPFLLHVPVLPDGSDSHVPFWFSSVSGCCRSRGQQASPWVVQSPALGVAYGFTI